MLIKRNLFDQIYSKLVKKPKIILLFGPRQAGKTTLLKQILNSYQKKSLYFDGEDIRVQEIWSRPDASFLKKQIVGASLIVIDEAQKIENIGSSLKLVYDHFSPHIIASGSASFDLAQKISEPLTGRSLSFYLYPFSVLEIPIKPPAISFTDFLEDYLRFGLYPEVVVSQSESEKIEYLSELINNYLYKDILSFQGIKKPRKVVELLTLLALQIGNEVSINEISRSLSLSKIIVEKYLDVLEKMFVIKKVNSFSRNLRKEVVKSAKYYFVDLGLRNSLIKNFNPLHLRSDTGTMFENFCFLERLKIYANQRQFVNYYFWRTYDGKEIDLVEEKQGKIFAYEFKWQKGKKTKAGEIFAKIYPNSRFKVITRENLEEFLV